MLFLIDNDFIEIETSHKLDTLKISNLGHLKSLKSLNCLKNF